MTRFTCCVSHCTILHETRHCPVWRLWTNVIPQRSTKNTIDVSTSYYFLMQFCSLLLLSLLFYLFCCPEGIGYKSSTVVFKDASMPTLLSLSDTCLYIICLFKCFVRLSGFSSCSRGSRWRLTAVTSHPLHCACLWLCFQFNKMWHLFLALCSMKLCKDTVDWEGGCVYQCDWCATVCARQTAQLLEFISFSRNWKCSTNHLNLTKTT